MRQSRSGATGCGVIKTYCHDYGVDEYDCEYDTTILCDECMYVVGAESGDRRRGKDPSAKAHQKKRGLT